MTINAATSIIPLTEIPQNWHQYRCIGFDLAHYNDIQNNINTDYNFIVMQPRDSGKPDRMQSLNYM